MQKLAAFVAATILVFSAGVLMPASGELVAKQEASWGLSDFGNSTTVGRFSALGWAVEEAGDRMLVGGNFLNVTNGRSTEAQPYLAAFEVSSGKWDSTFTPDVERPVLTMENSPDGGLVLGGEIRRYEGVDVSSLVKIDPETGDIWDGWSTRVWGGSNVVREVSMEPDGWMYVAGTFTNASDGAQSGAVNNLIRMNPETGAIDWSWTPVITGGSVWGVSASRTNSSVYVVGWFTNAAGHDGPAVGIDTNDDSRVTWDGFQMNMACCGHMFDVEATEFGTVFAIGEQHAAYVYDENQDMKVLYTHVTNWDSRYQDNNNRRGGDYQEIERVGNRMYATCHCWGSHSTYEGYHETTNWDLALNGGTHTGRVNSIIAYDAQTGVRDQALNPYMAGDIGGFGVKGASDGCLWITGGINVVGEPGDQAAARDLVRLCDEDFSPPEVPGPEECIATPIGGNIEVTWPGVAQADEYVIYRTVDGGTRGWRGRVAATEFTDTNRDATLEYYVASKEGNVLSQVTKCDSGTPVPVDISAPASCTATFSDDRIDVEWDEVDEASAYVVYRSVNGARQRWRGRVSETSFEDTPRDDVELAYAVLSVNEDEDRSELVECGSEQGGGGGEPDGPQPVASCSVEVVAGDVKPLKVTWSGVADADQYVVYRSVDNSRQFWRGRTTDESFDDSRRDGVIEYYVATKLDNQFSERVTCTPQV